MWEKMKKLLVRRSDRVLGLDIGTGSVKLAEIVQGRSASVLQSYAIAELPDNAVEDGQIQNREAVVEAIRKLITNSGATCREVVVAVSGRALFVREISMPVMTTEELREALKWDLDKYVPYSADSCYFDFAVLGHGQTELELRVLLVIAPNQTVEELIGLVKEAGLKPVAVDIEALALNRTLQAAENAMIIDIGTMSSQLFVYQGGCPAVTRIIPIGGRRFTEVVMNVLELEYHEAERLKQRQKGLLQRVDIADDSAVLHRQLSLLAIEIAREVRRTAEYYQIQNKGASIDRLILTGGGAGLDNLAQHLALLLDTEVVLHKPLAGVRVAGSYDQQTVEAAATQLAVAIGLSMRGE